MNFSSNDCDEILKAKFAPANYQLLSFELTPLSEEKLGFMCDYFVLTAEVLLLENRKVQEKFFVKAIPADEEHRRICLEMNAHYKEECMFTKIVPTFLQCGLDIISECIPQCYLIKQNNFIVMEDLTTKGYRMLPAREFLGVSSIKTALKSVAKIHACGFVLEERLTKTSGAPYRMGKHFRDEFKESFYSDSKPNVEYLKSIKISVDAQIDLFSKGEGWKIPRELFKERVQKILDGFEGLVEESQTFRNTMCHGDLWANNLMFKFQEEDPIPSHCVLIDFQGYRYCPPAQDVMALLYFTTGNDFRGKHLNEILDFYYEELSKTLKDHDVEVEGILPRGDFDRSCEYYEVFAAAQAMREFHNIMIEPKMVKEFMEMPGGTENVFAGDRSAMFLELCEKDAVYRSMQQEAVESLRILCEKQKST